MRESLEKLLRQTSVRRLLVGFSGGSDSTALLLLADAVCRRCDLKLTAVHFEHGLRGAASLRDAAFCRRFAAKRRIAFEQYDLDVPRFRAADESMESAARRLRQEKWRELTAGDPDCAVLLAHHGDDCEENLILRLARGANVSGLVSPRELIRLDGVLYLRPLLGSSKAELTAFLRENGVKRWRTDASNFDCRYDRNRVRRRILPEIARLQGGAGNVGQSLAALRCDADCLERLADAEYAKIAGEKKVGRQFFAALHDAILLRVVRRFVGAASGRDFIPDGAFLSRLHTLLDGKSEGVRQIPCGDGRLVREYEEVFFEAMAEPPPHLEIFWNWRETPELVVGGVCVSAELGVAIPEAWKDASDVFYFDADGLPDVLTLRTRRDGDRMTCFGGGEKRLKKLFIDAKVPPSERERALLLCAGETILAVFGLRRGASAPVCFPEIPKQTVAIRVRAN